MSINWKEVIGFNDEQIQNIRTAGELYRRQGHYKTALTYWRAICIFDKTSVFDQQMLGALLLEVNQAQEAVPVLEKALALQPKHYRTHLNLARALLDSGRKAEALAKAKELVLCPDALVADRASAILLAFT